MLFPHVAHSRALPALIMLAGLAAAPAALAQVAPAPSAAAGDSAAPANENAAASSTAPAGGETIKLTPFEVQADKNNGYYAPNTLSGTRINSKIEDLPASITVVTKQQLMDTASVDINDIFRFESNTEGTFNYTAQLSNAPTNDQIQSSPQTATRIRGLSQPNLAINDFVLATRIPVDTYDIESVEISRGPNSTLFGLGQASGTVNINTLAADVTRDFNSLTGRVDSYGGWDQRFDFNRVILRNKLAVRVAGDYGDYAYVRKPSYDEVRRLYGTASWRPFPNTNIKLIYEHFKENRQTPNQLTPRDGVSEWIADGKPSWNPLTFTATGGNGQTITIPNVGTGSAENGIPGGAATLPAGLLVNTTNYTRPSIYIDAGQIQLWEINRLDTSSNYATGSNSSQRMLQGSGSLIMRGDINGGVLYQVPGVSNKALYDWTRINAVSPDWNYDHASLYTITAEQELLPNLWLRGGWHLEASDTYNRNIVNPPVLEVDVNQYLLDGRANPFYLRPFYQSTEPTIFRSPEYNDNLQAQLTYELNFQKIANNKGWLKWLGDHRLLGYYESRHITDATMRYREAIDDPNHAWLTPGALNYTNGVAQDRPTYRYYVGPVGAVGYTPGFTPPKSGVKGTFNINYNIPGQGWISEPAQYGTVPYLGGQTRQEVTSRGLATQSFFLDNRIVITTGLRKDFTRSRTSFGNVDDPTTGIYEYGPTNQWNPWSNATGLTRTIGAVVKPFPWIGIFADKSNSFVPQAPAVDLFDQQLPNTYGRGKDFGLWLSFFHDKLVFRGSIYRTAVQNDRNGDTTIGSRILRMDTYAVTGIGTTSDRFSFQYWAYNVASAKLNVPFTTINAAPQNVVSAANAILQYPSWTPQLLSDIASGEAIRGVNDTLAKGAELEIDYNPSYNWNFKITGAQTKAIQTALEKDISDYLTLRLPVWLAAKDDAGNAYWTSTAYGANSGTATSFYTGSVNVPIEIAQALLGKSNPQVKEYSAAALGKYNFTRGWLNRASVGGDIRWSSESSIGYLGAAADPDGIIRSLDVNRAAHDPARYSTDVFVQYKLPVYGNRAQLSFQLNWNNMLQQNKLRAVAVNPDGQVYNWRIIDPQQLIFTTTLSF